MARRPSGRARLCAKSTWATKVSPDAKSHPAGSLERSQGPAPDGATGRRHRALYWRRTLRFIPPATLMEAAAGRAPFLRRPVHWTAEKMNSATGHDPQRRSWGGYGANDGPDASSTAVPPPPRSRTAAGTLDVSRAVHVRQSFHHWLRRGLPDQPVSARACPGWVLPSAKPTPGASLFLRIEKCPAASSKNAS